jgi:hypothetical protein
MTDFDVGQEWRRGRGIWQTGKRIVEVDQSRSVTFLKVESMWGGDASWISAGLFTAWIEDNPDYRPVPCGAVAGCGLHTLNPRIGDLT